MPDDAYDDPSAAPPTPPPGPWALVWREFARRRGAMFGLALVAAFWLLALGAPLLAHRLPFVWIEDGATSFPLPRELLSPYDLRHEGALEKALVFLLLYLPLAGGAWLALGRWGPAAWKRSRRGVALTLAGLLALSVCGAVGQIIRHAAGADPLYHEAYAIVNQDEVHRPAALGEWIAAGAGGLAGVPEAFAPEEIRDFAAWPRRHPDATDPYDASHEQRARARLLAAGLTRAVAGAELLAPPGGMPDSRRARELFVALAAEPSAASAPDRRQRLNRLILEANAPAGTLQSFRSFRSGFLLAAALGIAAALGVAAILLIGANELRADGRWLALVVLAALTASPFLFELRPGRDGEEGGQADPNLIIGRLAWRVPRNQPLDYRAAAAAGRGRGWFPPLPYGPDEQGFGPKLPPDWAAPAARLSEADLPRWEAAVPQLAGISASAFSENGDGDAGQDAALPARRHIWSLLPPAERDALPALAAAYWQGLGQTIAPPSPVAEAGKPPEESAAASAASVPVDAADAAEADTLNGLWATALQLPEGRRRLVEMLNGLLPRPEFYAPAAFAGLHVEDDFDLRPYLVDLGRGGDVAVGAAGVPVPAPRDVERRNRLLLQKAFPGVFREAAAGRWKKPHQKDGYHWLGTDESGRDVLVRMLHGARVSLSVGFVSVALATLIGLVAGALAAYYGGWVDWLVSRAIELMMCFPAFFLILAMIAVLDKRSILNIMLVIGFTGWTGVARLVRGEILQQRSLDYVASARTMGAGDARIIFRHILPNSLAPVFVSVTFGITGAILTESGLSFLGLGVTPPTPTWGQLLAEAREAPLVNWWLAVFPGAALFLGVFSYNLVGEGVRDALDPRLRGGHR